MTPFGVYITLLVLLFSTVVVVVVGRLIYRAYNRSNKKDQYIELKNSIDIETSVHHFSPINPIKTAPNKTLTKQLESKKNSSSNGSLSLELPKPTIPKVRSSNGLELKVSQSENGRIVLTPEYPLLVDNSNLTPAKRSSSSSSMVSKSVSPIPPSPATDKEWSDSQLDLFDAFADQIDSFIRHRKDFIAPNYYYSVKQLETQIALPKEFKDYKLTLVAFLKSRSEFKMHSQLSFSLVHLTPYRYSNHRLYGKFQCNNVRCKGKWSSSYSFSDSYQLCVKCKSNKAIFPYEQKLFNTITRRELAGCQETKHYFEVSEAQREEQEEEVLCDDEIRKISTSSRSSSGGYQQQAPSD